MMPMICTEQAPVPPPSYHRAQVQAQAQRARALHINALRLIETLHLLALCRLAVQLAHCRVSHKPYSWSVAQVCN